MNSPMVFLIPLLGLAIWLAFFKKSTDKSSSKKSVESQWLTLKLKQINIQNGYEFVQSLYDLGFQYDEKHQIFNYVQDKTLWFRCLNLAKPGRFDNLEDGKKVSGLMFVTDIATIEADRKPICLQRLIEVVTVCQEQYGGQLYDENGVIQPAQWLEDTLSWLHAQTKQDDMLSV